MVRAKSKKLNGNGDANRCRRLGDLPNVTLINILSKLPAKDAVRTSVVSKRWQYLWTYVGILRFDQHQFSRNSIFMDFVDKVLLLHDQSSLKELHLSCDLFPYTYRINSWISTAIRRNVEVLKLCLRVFQPSSNYMLPHCLFNSRSLKTFYLDMPCDLNLPSSLCIPSLEELSLSQVKFTDASSTHNLLSSPALERLSISQCQWKISSGSICAPKLQSLSIDDPNESSSEPEIAILSPSLRSFSYAGMFSTGFNIYSSPQLVEAKIDSTHSFDCKLQAYRLVKMLKGLQCVKVLTLSSQCFEILARKHELPRYLPEFGNLTNLDLDTSSIRWGHETFLEILKKCPHLTTLKLNMAKLFPEVSKYSRYSENSECSSRDSEDPEYPIYDEVLDFDEPVSYTMPPCFEAHLKKITIQGFWPIRDQLASISLFLEEAKVLEEMVIYSSRTNGTSNEKDLVRKKEILKRLQELPKGSEHCKVSLI